MIVTIWTILGLALGLSMDAFSVSMVVAATGKTPRQTFRLSFHFGLFQFFMPLIGGFVGITSSERVGVYAPWAAFGILFLIGAHMLYESRFGDRENPRGDRSRGWSLVFLATSTSIDALGVGFTMGLNAQQVFWPCVVIGVVCGIVSFVGVRLGRRLSRMFGRYAEAFGGIVLIALAFMFLVKG